MESYADTAEKITTTQKRLLMSIKIHFICITTSNKISLKIKHIIKTKKNNTKKTTHQ